MKIMCLNGWGGKLADRLLPYIEAVCPDILCLQEVSHTPGSPQPSLIYRDGKEVLEQRANFLSEVAAALPGYTATFCPAERGLLWDGSEPVWSLWGIATFISPSLAVIGQAQDFVHGSFSPEGFSEHPRPRSAHAVRIHQFETARTVTIAHMHGLRIPGDKSDNPERLAQAERFAGLITRTARSGDLVVACGDFNVEPGSVTFDVLGRSASPTSSPRAALPARAPRFIKSLGALPIICWLARASRSPVLMWWTSRKSPTINRCCWRSERSSERINLQPSLYFKKFSRYQRS